MKIDLTCPVELWQSAMPAEDVSECTFVMNNLSHKVVVSILLTLSCYDQDNRLLFRQSERMQGLKAEAGERFSVMMVPNEWKNVKEAEVTIEKVWFDDATIWRKGNAPLVNYTPNTLQPGRALDELRFVAGQDAMGYPEVQQQAWLCVCGRANPLDSARCCRCERGRDAVFASFSRENVRQVIAVHEKKLADVATEARKENSRLLEEENKQRRQQRRRKNRVIRWSVAGALALAAVLFGVFWVLPTLRYNAAVEKLTAGQYDEARTAFAAMGDYRDAAERQQECDYQKALSLREMGGADNLTEAEKLFSGLNGYQDSEDQRQKTVYLLGESYLADKLYDKAMESFQSLGDYEDSTERCRQCAYEQAEELLSMGNENVALALYMNLSGYQDADDKVRECYYRLAAKQADEGNDEEAIRLYLLSSGWEDAEEQRQAAVYRLAEKALADGDLKTAGERYLEIADYQDALAKGNDCLYQYGRARMEQEDYEGASEAFRKISDYLDSLGQAEICDYHRAVQLMEQQAYDAAAPLLESAGSYADAAELLQQCRYQQAKTAVENSDYQSAEQLLAGLTGYQDSDSLLQDVRYQLVQAAISRSDYAAALETLELLGRYQDSETLKNQCRYELAKSQFAAGDYTSALENFTQLGDYEDCAQWVKDTEEKIAQSYQESGDVQAALENVGKLDDEQAVNTLNEMILNEGVRLENEQKYQEAIDLYEQMGDNERALERISACRYQLALAQKDAGELKAAGDAFAALGDYEDAAQQASDCYDQLYSAASAAAREALAEENYPAAIRALQDVDRTNLPRAYRDLEQLYQEACYSYADQLYRNHEPYRAMPFYQEAIGYRDAESKLKRRAYLILGAWESASGTQAEFHTDGTCTLLGEELYFRVSNFSLMVGNSPDSLESAFQISQLTAKGMSLRDLRDGQKRDYKFTKTAEAEMPAMELKASAATAAPTETPAPAETPQPEETVQPDTMDAPADEA